ncbi:hypothetical protein VKI21_02130 [Cyanobacterium aponinum UTEX 3222]|nr:hypothetical protein VKI21_02130 [Cyanobacterium aponinum UTEX 3222]
MLLEITKTIIGCCLLSIIAMYAQFLSKSCEYQRLSAKNAQIWGNIRYNLNVKLRNIWTRIYEIEDRLKDRKIKSIQYFQ